MSAGDHHDPDIPSAATIETSRCEHGHVHLQLLDEAGACFALAALEGETALALATDLWRHGEVLKAAARAPEPAVH